MLWNPAETESFLNLQIKCSKLPYSFTTCTRYLLFFPNKLLVTSPDFFNRHPSARFILFNIRIVSYKRLCCRSITFKSFSVEMGEPKKNPNWTRGKKNKIIGRSFCIIIDFGASICLQPQKSEREWKKSISTPIQMCCDELDSHADWLRICHSHPEHQIKNELNADGPNSECDSKGGGVQGFKSGTSININYQMVNFSKSNAYPFCKYGYIHFFSRPFSRNWMYFWELLHKMGVNSFIFIELTNKKVSTHIFGGSLFNFQHEGSVYK